MEAVKRTDEARSVAFEREFESFRICLVDGVEPEVLKCVARLRLGVSSP